MVWVQFNLIRMPIICVPCIRFVLLKYWRMVRVLLVGGVVGLDFCWNTESGVWISMGTISTFNHNIKPPMNIMCIQKYHQHHKHHINTVHQNFTWKLNAGKNHKMIFLFIKEYIHWKHQLPISPATIGRRLQPLIYRLQPKGISTP